jgi:predicted nucleic acid-binding protein
LDIVIDSSALLAVILGEPEREKVIGMTVGNTLIGPGSIPWEVGNAFSAMLKEKRLSLGEAQKGVEIFEAIPIRYVAVDMAHALSLAVRMKMYAYDAYFVDCAIRHGAPLLTLDRRLKHAARSLKVAVLEV